MNFRKDDFIENLYETSKSQKDNSALLNVSEQEIEVYDMDAVKDWFCQEYRNNQNIRSCDAYYQDDNKNCLLVEFKNTHHLKMKSYQHEILEKFTDTHMLLAETFWRNRKTADIGKKVQLILVYNDNLDYGRGIQNISNALNGMKPRSGNKTRKSSGVDLFKNKEEFESFIREIQNRYEKNFFNEVNFIEKKVFYEQYIEGKYFHLLSKG